jgi:hypothetical protein
MNFVECSIIVLLKEIAVFVENHFYPTVFCLREGRYAGTLLRVPAVNVFVDGEALRQVG